MNWKVYGYGQYGQPLEFRHAQVMAADADLADANDIADALARKFIGQWFGVVRPDGQPEKPFRYRREVAL